MMWPLVSMLGGIVVAAGILTLIVIRLERRSANRKT